MRRLIIAGHSLGAMRGAICAALGALAGRPSVAYVGFGEPKPGYLSLRQLLEAHGVMRLPHSNGDQNGHDLVTDVPWTLPGLDYRHSNSLIHVGAAPEAGALHALKYHSMELYLKATIAAPMVIGDTTVTTSVVAELCNEIYKIGGGSIKWTSYYDDKQVHGICYGIYQTSEIDFIIFRGSLTALDWFRDFDHFAIPTNDPQLGMVHPGAVLYMRDVWNDVWKVLYSK